MDTQAMIVPLRDGIRAKIADPAVACQAEQAIAMLPHCHACLSPPGNLQACPHCHMQWACKDGHGAALYGRPNCWPTYRAHHEKTACRTVQFINRIDVVLSQRYCAILRTMSRMIADGLPVDRLFYLRWCQEGNVKRQLLPKGSARDAAGCHTLSAIDTFITYFACREFDPSEHPYTADAVALRAALSEPLSHPLTIIQAMEDFLKSGALTIADGSTFVLHVLGAEMVQEMNFIDVFEEIMHFFPAIAELRIYFIGPNVPVMDENIRGPAAMETCPKCTASGRRRKLAIINGYYHDFVKSAQFERPSLAVAFNSGVSQEERESWLPTLKSLSDLAVPFVFTCFNEYEADADAEFLRDAGLKLSKGPEKNRWASERPYVDAMLDDCFYQRNNWWICGGGRVVKK